MIFRIIFLCILFVPISSFSRDYIHIVGSTTLFPFISVASEEFARTYRTRTPIVESIGTGAGFKLFCAGLGEEKPDVVAASRKITESEIVLCQENGIKKSDIFEIKLGNDGIVIANSIKSTLNNFSKNDLFSALSFYVPNEDLLLVKNNYENWDEISPIFKHNNIEIYGPLKNTGTYESMINMIFSDICLSNKAFKRNYVKHDDLSKVCSMVRDDGKFVEVGTDENIIVQKMEKNLNAFGIFGYGFYVRNADKVQANLINGIAPTYDKIASGEYVLSRPLYLYVKKSQTKPVSELKMFLKEILSNNSVGKYGYLTSIGLIATTSQELEITRNLIEEF